MPYPHTQDVFDVPSNAPSHQAGAFGMSEVAMSARHHVLDIYGVHLHLATTQREWSTLRRKQTWLVKKPNASGLAAPWLGSVCPP